MRDLTNDIVVQTTKDGMNYLQFKVLLNLGVKHAYAMKAISLSLNILEKLWIKLVRMNHIKCFVRA